MDEMTKQGIAARMAKAAIELDRLEKEKKETVREYNEQINEVQDEIISLARQYEGAEAQPSLFDVSYEFQPATDPEIGQEQEATYDPTYEVAEALDINDVLDTERIVIQPDIPGGALRAVFRKHEHNPDSVCFTWSIDAGLGDYILPQMVIYEDKCEAEGLSMFPQYLKEFKDHVDDLLSDRGESLEDTPVSQGLRVIRDTIGQWITVITKHLIDNTVAEDDELPFPETEEPQELKYIPSEEDLTMPENPAADYHAKQHSPAPRKRRVKRGAL